REAMDYKAYLTKVVALTKAAAKPEVHSSYPAAINTAPLRALYDNLHELSEEELQTTIGAGPGIDPAIDRAVRVDEAIRDVKKAGWRGNRIKEREVRGAIKSVLASDAVVDAIFEIVKKQREY